MQKKKKLKIIKLLHICIHDNVLYKYKSRKNGTFSIYGYKMGLSNTF